MPSDLEFYYDYYTQDFELRYPDMDMYLCNINGKEKYNKLFYKEYDKIIALVEWVDSHYNDDFIQGFENHFNSKTAFGYYLGTLTVGLIDNFGKNLMINTWGLDKNGQTPYKIINLDNKSYHAVWKYKSNWDDEEEYY